LFSLEDLNSNSPGSNSPGAMESASGDEIRGWNLPAGRHVLLAGCRSNEVARECAHEGKQRGIFSQYLLRTLQNTNSALTYRELYKQTSSLVRADIKDQTPQLEAKGEDMELPFLGAGGVIAKREPTVTLSWQNEKWLIDKGAVHGIPVGTELALYPLGSSVDAMRKVANAIGRATVVEVLAHQSVVKVSVTDTNQELKHETTYNGVLVNLPLPKLGVCLEGDQAALDAVREALKTSLYVEEVTSAAKYRLLATGEQYAITKPADPRPLVQQLKGFSPDNGRRAVQHLEAMARWETAGQLASSPGCRISADEVKMEFYTADKKEKIEESLIRLTYTHDAGKSKPPCFRMKLSNHSDKKLFCTVLVLGADYSIKAPLFQHQGVWIEAGQEFWAFGDKVIPATIKDDYWKQGITEYQDILMLIACTQEFDASLMEQVGLNPPTRNRSISPGKGRLSHLLHKVAQRDIGDVESEELDEWMTSSITVITTRPQDETPISNREEVDLGLHLKVKPHSALQATVRLSTISQSTRDVGGNVLPSELLDNSSPFQFTNGRGVDPGLSCLELKLTAGETHDKSETKSWQSVTPENPLKLSVEQKLEEGEYVLPISFDGEFYIPLGLGKTKDNTTEITIERLTDPISQGQRSLGGSIRIFFRKVFANKLGLDFPYPILSAVSYKNKDKPEYIAKVEEVAANVNSANKIILFLHGIIGDTQSIVPCVQEEIKEFGDAKSLNNIYDLVLAFDYENLNTPIQELGQQLGQRLAAVGLGPNHGKTLHIVAHSMGGLVSRSFIEQAGGKHVVQHLIMLGTPNGGSPWSTVQDWAFTALTLGINGLAVSGMPIAALGNLLAGVEAIDVNLDQMKPNSKFLAALRQSEDPRVPYTIVAGNTSIIKPVNNESSGKFLRLFEKLEKLRKSAVEFPFLGEPNDIACLVSSIKDLPPDRKFPAQIIEVACNHLVYFSDAEGLKALGKALLGTGVHADLDPENGPQQPAINPNKVPEVQKIELNMLEHKPAKAAISEVQSETQTNRIAVSPHGLSQSQTIKGFNHSYAVIIGIDQYSGGIPKLSNAVNDAKRISEILEQDHGYDVTTLIDEHATQLSIIELLTNDLGAKVKPDDRLLLYFAGHGLAQDDRDGKGPQGYFIPYDAIMHDPKTYVSMKNLRDALRDINCRHFLGLLDCCYAGSFRWSSYRDIGDSLKSEMFLESYHHYISEAAWQVIASSSYDEKAHDSSPLDQKDLFESSSRERSRGGEHSPFASALINGLSGKADRLPDGVITADELNMYIYDEVVKITESAGKRQTPQIWSFNESHKGKYIFLTPGLGELKLRKAPVLKEGTNPYKGLEAYEREDANSFFGRKEEVEKLFEFVKGNPLTVLMGASGSGKSSLVKAGLIPRVESIATASKQQAVLKAQPGNETEKAWSVMTMHPGEKPFENLATAFSRSINGEQCISSKDGFLDSLSNWFQKIPDCRLLIIIDQSEELITQCTDQVRKEFLTALTSGLVKYKSCLHILFTLRSDMEPQLRSHMAPLLLEMDPNRGWSTVRHFIGAMTRSQLREAIEKPAEEITMFFKPHTLVEDLVNEVADMPGALPLLSFAMSQLYTKYLERQRDAQIKNDNIERAMTKEDYEAIGGVIASLNKKANQVHEDLVKKSPGNDHMIRHMMLRMVAIEGGENARRPVPMSELDFPEEKDCQINEIIESFVSARLLVRKGASGKTTEQANSLESADRSSNKQVNDTALKDEGFLEPAHDALVTGWTKLQEWLQEYRHNIPLQRQLTPRAFEWHEKAGKDPQLSFVQKSIKVLDKRFLTIETNLARLIPKRKNPLLAASTSLLWTNDPYLEVINTQNQTNKWLNKVEAEFVSKSNLQKRKNSSWRNRTIASVLFAMASLTAVAWWQKLDSDRRRINAEVVSNTLQADEHWKNRNELEALVGSLKAVKLIKQSKGIDYDIKLKAILTLNQIVSGIRQQQILEGNSISFSHDGNMIATGTRTRLNLWNAKGIKIQESDPHLFPIQHFVLAPNGKTIAYTLDQDDGIKGLRLWDVEAKESMLIKLPKGGVGDICDVIFKPNSNLISATDNKANVIEASIQGKNVAIMKVGSPIGPSLCPKLSPDGKSISSSSLDKTIRVTSIVGHAFKDIRVDDAFGFHEWSPDGKSIAYRNVDRNIGIKNLLGNKVIFLKDEVGKDYSNQFSFSPDGKTLALAGFNGILLYGLEDHGRIIIPESTQELKFSPDGNILASMSYDGSVKLWDWRRETTSSIYHGININAVMFSSDSQTITTTTDDSIYSWNKNGRFRSRLIENNDKLISVVTSPDGKTLAYISEDINGKKKINIRLPNLDVKSYSLRMLDTSSANKLFLSPDGKTLAIETDDAYELHSLERNSKIATIDKVLSFDGFGFIRTEDGQTLFLLNAGPEVKLCNLRGDCKLTIKLKGQEEVHRRIIRGHQEADRRMSRMSRNSLYAISASSNGKILATKDEKNVKLWNLKGDLKQTLQGHTEPVTTLAFMPNGEAIATGSTDKIVKIWSINGKLIMNLPVDDGLVQSLSISPDGQTIVAKMSNMIKIWNVDADYLLSQGCILAEDYLNTTRNQQLCADVIPIKYTDKNPPPGFFAQGGLTCQAREPGGQNSNHRRREEEASCTLGSKAFNGRFVDNQFLGYDAQDKNQGLHIFRDGSYCVAPLSKGELHGQGECWLVGKQHYKGSFANGKFNGMGILTNNDGSKFEGLFKNDKPVQALGIYKEKDATTNKLIVIRGLPCKLGTDKDCPGENFN
jgi:WD40 repeat protein/pimeloyl-ACP methyl ester carboxylesterase